MKKPYILPSGSSYEEASLRSYFKTNGEKDPITRSPINSNLIIHNLGLQKYIQEHPRVKLWEKYEHDFIHS